MSPVSLAERAIVVFEAATWIGSLNAQTGNAGIGAADSNQRSCRKGVGADQPP